MSKLKAEVKFKDKGTARALWSYASQQSDGKQLKSKSSQHKEVKTTGHLQCKEIHCIRSDNSVQINLSFCWVSVHLYVCYRNAIFQKSWVSVHLYVCCRNATFQNKPTICELGKVLFLLICLLSFIFYFCADLLPLVFFASLSEQGCSPLHANHSK